ncbi:MAG: hypothetical protein OQL19_20795 [Gammaproteobacteria bacterium]|nr:hypothetical protein [Gammaproteobacteria bacterium]
MYKKWFSWVVRILGLFLLVTYLFVTNDFSFSLGWMLLHVVIVIGVSVLVTQLEIEKYFPVLNTYHVHSKIDEKDIQYSESEDEYYKKKITYMEGMFDKSSIFFIASEDGLICVPLLFSGLNPFSILVAGVVFGWLHLARFTYLECIVKGLTYTIICYLVLPAGILTVIAGHYLTDILGFIVLKIAKNHAHNEETI